MDILEAEKILFSEISFQRGSNKKSTEVIEAELVIADALSKQHKFNVIVNGNEIDCPTCGCKLSTIFTTLLDRTPYCKLCGQKLDWSEHNE